MKLTIVNTTLPPRLDGIGDYTANMARCWAKSCDVTIWTAQAECLPIEGVREIRRVFDVDDIKSVTSIADAVRQNPPDWLMLQYNPFGYGKRGFNPHLPLTLHRIRRENPGVKIALMAHETFVPPISLGFLVMRTWQIPQFRGIASASNVIGFSIDPWAKKWRPKLAPTPVHHFPVGSNIPRVETTKAAERARLNIAPDAFVVGTFGTAHPSRLFPLIGETVERIAALETRRPLVFLDLGPHAAPIVPVKADVQTIAGGPHSTDALSRYFAAMDLYLSPFVDGVSTRRTTLMTGLQHGIPTVGTSALHTDEILQKADGTALLLSPVSQPERFAANALRLHADSSLRMRLGMAGADFYNREFEWSVVAERFLQALVGQGT